MNATSRDRNEMMDSSDWFLSFVPASKRERDRYAWKQTIDETIGDTVAPHTDFYYAPDIGNQSLSVFIKSQLNNIQKGNGSKSLPKRINGLILTFIGVINVKCIKIYFITFVCRSLLIKEKQVYPQ